MSKSGLDFVKPGQQYKFSKTVGETDVLLFAGITGDFSDTHINDEYMRRRSNLKGRIAHGALMVGYMSTASTLSLNHCLHEEGLSDFPVSQGYDKVRFIRPVEIGDTITVEYTVASVDRETGRSRAKVEVYNQRREVVAASEHIMRWSKKLQTANDGNAAHV